MRTSKITESQILEGIKAGLNDSQIAKMYGVTQGGISPRCKKLRASLTAQEEPDPEPTAPPLATVPWESLRKDMRLLWGKKRFIVRSLDGGTCVLTSMGGQAIPLTREEFERRGFSPVPEGDPQGAPVIEYKLESVTKTEPKYEPKTETVVVKKPESSGQKIMEVKTPILTPGELETVLDNLQKSAPAIEYFEPDGVNCIEATHDPYESLIMAKAREDVAKFQAVRAEIQKRLDTADHIPLEILNDYEKLIQAAGR